MDVQFVLVYGIAACALALACFLSAILLAQRDERLPLQAPFDAPSIILIAVVCCVCLLASLWVASSGADLSANLL